MLAARALTSERSADTVRVLCGCGRGVQGLQMLGLRGISVFGSSGDGGSHWSFQEFSPATAMGRALNQVRSFDSDRQQLIS